MAVTVDIFNPQHSVIAHGLDGKTIMIYGKNGLGKAQPVDTMIPTPEGFKRLGDLKVGDYVFNRSGEPTKVLEIHEQGLKDNYKVTLSDGRETYCNDEHLWSVWTSRGHLKTLTLREMLDTGLRNSTNTGWRFQIPNNGEVEYSTKDLKVDPYVMGCFIGDGCTTCRALTFSSPEVDIVNDIATRIGAERAKKNSDNNYNWSFVLKEEDRYKAGNGDTILCFQTQKLFESYPEVMSLATEKSIPNDYMFGDIKQRWELVRGLMDTDGTISVPAEEGQRVYQTSYATNSAKLAEQVATLLRSLGIKARVGKYDRDDRDHSEYVVSVNMDNTERYKLFKNSVKMERAIKAKEFPSDKDYDRVGIVKVEKMEDAVEMRCIYVKDSEHLYLTNDYVVTHNTAQTTRAEKPYVFACESGLNGISGVAYNKINNWRDFKTAVKQFTSKDTIDKAKEFYKTIIIDEVYASSIFCQDYICQRLGIASFGDNENSRINAWQEYEKEYWREVNKLVNSGFTVIFIAHAEEKDGFVVPKGDKRCINPIVDNCDIVAYIQSNGVDENGKVIHSSAYFAQTDKFFARSRFTYMTPYIEDFTIENFMKAINDAIDDEAKTEGIKTVDYAQQVEQNTTVTRSYDELMAELGSLGEKMASAGRFEELTEIVEDLLGKGKKANSLKKGQEQIIETLIDNLKDALKE